MSIDTQNIVNKAWNFAHVLRDDGLSYMAYTDQITFLLFLKMADELTRPPYKRPPIVPPALGWPSLLAKDGDELEAHYRHILEEVAVHGAGTVEAASRRFRREWKANAPSSNAARCRVYGAVNASVPRYRGPASSRVFARGKAMW